MALAAATKLGPYEILSPLGAGGMGEVYRARDTRLGREVAIKVLPAGLTDDPDRLRRFAQEARAASSLNHPNILTIHDIGSVENGTAKAPYLVTELLEGETLRGLLRKQASAPPEKIGAVSGEKAGQQKADSERKVGALPMQKAIGFAVQIAHGLAAAHHKGIVHRDLKPENIFICKDGRVKILDFGLAKLTEAKASDGSDSGATLSSLTLTGTVLGTVGYMSPEQLRGLAADWRSDIFNLGAIVYEMLAGQRAFTGSTSADISSAILREDPPRLTAANPRVPPAVDRIVRHCLEKEPEDRFQSAQDVAFALQSLSTPSDSATSTVLPTVHAEPQARKIPASQALLWAALAVLIVVVAIWALHASSVKQVGHSAVVSERLTDFVGLEEFPAISPDGKSIAFISDAGGRRQLWVRLLSGGVPLQLTHDAVEHLYPRWSRDSASIIYYTPPGAGQSQGALWELSALGGFPRQLASSISGADVNHDGTKLAFFTTRNKMVQLVSAERDGSNPRIVFETPSFDFSFPRWSPDDRWIAYQHATAIWSDDIYVVASAGGQPRRLTPDGQLMGGLAWTADGSSIIYSSARGSTILYLPTLQLWLMSRDGGTPQQLTYGDAVYEHPDVAGTKIVASRRKMQFDLWKYPVGEDAAQNVRNGVRLTQQSGGVYTPTVSPDDKQIAFLSDSGGHGNIWVQDTQSGELRQITFAQDPHDAVGTPVWSPRGQQIAFATTHNLANWAGIGYSMVQSDGTNLRPIIPLGGWAAWSADGRFIYYTELTPGQPNVFSRMLKLPAEGGETKEIRHDGGIGAAPAPDGSALYYVLPLKNVTGGLDYEVRAARPENGASIALAKVSASRVPDWQGLHPTISHDGKWLALPLNDNYGTNIWLVSTEDGKLRQVTDFGERRTFIVRRVSWSRDDHFLYAAVAEGQEDVVLLDGLLQ